jgi:AraC-like DNA-binding protein
VIFCRHIPCALLAQFIDWFWFYEDWQPSHRREHVLPDGTFELVIDLCEKPRKLFDRGDENKYITYRHGWVSGTHSQYIIIDALPASSMIGAHFKPGGAAVFLDMPADEIRDRVVDLESIWGRGSRDLREQLLAAKSPSEKFHVLEQFLCALLARRKSELQRRVSWALHRFISEPRVGTIGDVVQDLGISHKHFIEQFRRQVGLTPKLFCRIQRFQEVLRKINAKQLVQGAQLAVDCGYFDQAHFVHDFQAFTGLNPSNYLGRQLEDPKFVTVERAR